MASTAMAAGIDPGAILSSSKDFMNYGPLGLAGLLIVLVFIAVMLRKVDGGRERILKLCLFVGAFCFIAALIAQHFAGPDYSKQRAVLGNVVAALHAATPKLEQINDMASAAGCPGEGHGILTEPTWRHAVRPCWPPSTTRKQISTR
jgi:hypothetical protein